MFWLRLTDVMRDDWDLDPHNHKREQCLIAVGDRPGVFATLAGKGLVTVVEQNGEPR